MKKIILTKGLPASGKSTWAKEQVNNDKGAYKRISKDDLRAMLDAGNHTKANESFILEIRDWLIIEALKRGKHVIVDDTNLNPIHEQRIKDIAKKYNAIVEIKDFTGISLEECIKRDSTRINSVGKDVIIKMYNRYLRPLTTPQIPKVKYDSTLDDCYIFDIDGTLALKCNRSPYDWSKVGDDDPNFSVINIYMSLKYYESEFKEGVKFIILSGRDSVCREVTEEWLRKNIFTYDELYMRPCGDMRKDSILKQEIYKKYVKGRYNVRAIFDDRSQVVETWRSLGLQCFQVAEGDF